MITNFKIYEKVWSKNIKEGDIYFIGEVLILEKGLKTTIELCKIAEKRYYYKDETMFNIIIKTYLKENLTEIILENFDKSLLKRKATQEEIQEFEAIENSKKYNL